MSSGIVFHLLAALAYAVLAFSLWRPLTKGGEQVNAGHIRRVCLAGAIVLHGIGLAQAIVPNHSLLLGWALALSAAVWLGMVVFWLENLVMRIDGLLLILLPAAAISAGMAAAFPHGHLVAHASSEWLRVHLLIALMAYGLITVAALQRSEEHTSELQSLMRISYAVFCLKKKSTTRRYRYKYNIEIL